MSLVDQVRERVILTARRWGTDTGEFSIPYPCATVRQVEDAEAQLGFRLPPLLRDIYLNVGNGGFGPGCGLIGIDNGKPFHVGNEAYNLVELYRNFLQQPTRHQPWSEKLLPICHWGCCYFSYLDCALPSAPVMAFSEDNHGHGPWGCAFGLHAASFEEWMQRWSDGEELWNSFNAIGEPIFWFEENPNGLQQSEKRP